MFHLIPPLPLFLLFPLPPPPCYPSPTNGVQIIRIVVYDFFLNEPFFWQCGSHTFIIWTSRKRRW